MPLRRNQKQLEQAVTDARSNGTRAIAHYHLALFHDNNGRESAAIPHYRQAISLGLDAQTHPYALSWLASSLFKTGHPTAALTCIQHAMHMQCPPNLTQFLTRLQRRIHRNRRTHTA